jgi:hypothetical protein
MAIGNGPAYLTVNLATKILATNQADMKFHTVV